MSTEENKATDQINLEQEKAKLEKFKKDLISVHEQLKTKTDLFNALKERGIESADQLTEKLTAQTKDEPAKENTLKVPDNPGAGNAEVEELKKIVEKQGLMLQRQEAQMQTNKLISEIQAEIKDKPEFALLGKALNESIAYNILRAQEADKEKGITKPLADYLKGTEAELKGFFTKLGGKIEDQPAGESTSGVATQNAPQKDTGSSDNLIDMPTLPATGSGEDTKTDPAQELIKSGTDPVTGKYDERQAFETDLKGFLSNPENLK